VAGRIGFPHIAEESSPHEIHQWRVIIILALVVASSSRSCP
jgi:hypothetical protein